MSVPAIGMIRRTVPELDKKAKELAGLLEEAPSLWCAVMREKSQVGGGSVPSEFIETRAVEVQAKDMSAALLEERLRREHSIICRIIKDKVVFDVRTLLEGDELKIAAALKEICGGK